jgi:hypothetical protein
MGRKVRGSPPKATPRRSIESSPSSPGENIDCDYERLDGYLFVPPGESTEILEKELKAAHRAGLRGRRNGPPRAPVVRHRSLPAFSAPGAVSSFEIPGCSCSGPSRSKGGRIFCQTHAEDFKDGAPTVTTTDKGATISASALVVATNSPVNDRLAIHTKQAAYRTFVIGGDRSQGLGDKGPLLGYAGSLPLHSTSECRTLRRAHRRGRRPQDRAGGRRRRSVSHGSSRGRESASRPRKTCSIAGRDK